MGLEAGRHQAHASIFSERLSAAASSRSHLHMLGYGFRRCPLDGSGSTIARLAAAPSVCPRRRWPSGARGGCAVLIGGGLHRDALDGDGSTDVRSAAGSAKTRLTVAARLMRAQRWPPLNFSSPVAFPRKWRKLPRAPLRRRPGGIRPRKTPLIALVVFPVTI
jgi:hypothetical protein